LFDVPVTKRERPGTTANPQNLQKFKNRRNMDQDVSATTPEVRSNSPWLRRFPLRSPTLPPATHTNAYLLGDGDLLLVDPGSPTPSENDHLLDAIAELRQKGHRLAAIFLTHHHYDHVSGTSYLKERLEVPLYAHAVTAELVRSIGLQVERTVSSEEVLPFGPAGCEAVFTPGHAPGHLCLLDRAGGGLIAGDMVASVGTIVVNPGDGGDMALYLASLERLLALSRPPRGATLAVAGNDSPSLRLWPAHGASVADGEKLLRFYLMHRREREERVLAALRQGSGTVQKLVPIVYADKPDANPSLASMSLLAHLHKLQREGIVVLKDDVWSVCRP
jgi:glyoxylase-like metal-dependent hydrolase (beta-lactamase superfamily II)